MCGLSGYSGIKHPVVREALVWALSSGIDERGGHAAGYVTMGDDDKPVVGRRLGHWCSAPDKFFRRASLGHTTLMHARYATCGSHTVQDAHPFAIRRGEKTVLWGAHNGVIYDARDSAKAFGRPYTVDSKEMFELLADDEIDTLQALQGYGVATWIEASKPGVVYMSRLTRCGEIYVASVHGGGVVWGSTQGIVADALDLCDLHQERSWTIETGRVYAIRQDGIFKTERDGIKLSAYAAPRWYSAYLDDETDKDDKDTADDLIKQWEQEDREADDSRTMQQLAYDTWLRNEGLTRDSARESYFYADGDEDIRVTAEPSEIDRIIDRNLY